MIKPRTLNDKEEVRRPTIAVAPGEAFAGWGPRLRY
jgi:hypothetical protein